MRQTGYRPRLIRASLLASALLTTGAVCNADSGTANRPATTTGAKEPGPGEKQTRVGNPSNTGMDTIPDWDRLAKELQQRVDPRLPDPLPTDAKLACTQMLDAARTFYESTEVNPEHQKQRLAQMNATREADLAGCIEDTSIAAASCVTILLGDHSAEFPWLVDQCSRAYPKQ